MVCSHGIGAFDFRAFFNLGLHHVGDSGGRVQARFQPSSVSALAGLPRRPLTTCWEFSVRLVTLTNSR